MIGLKPAALQVARLPKAISAERFAELVDTLKLCAQNEPHAKATIDLLIDAGASKPTPHELSVIAASVSYDPQGICQQCGGTTWVTTQLLVIDDAEVEVSRRCECVSGKAASV